MCCKQELMFLNQEQSTGSSVWCVEVLAPGCWSAIATAQLQTLMGHSASFALGVIVQLCLQPLPTSVFFIYSYSTCFVFCLGEEGTCNFKELNVTISSSTRISCFQPMGSHEVYINFCFIVSLKMLHFGYCSVKQKFPKPSPTEMTSVVFKRF